MSWCLFSWQKTRILIDFFKKKIRELFWTRIRVKIYFQMENQNKNATNVKYVFYNNVGKDELDREREQCFRAERHKVGKMWLLKNQKHDFDAEFREIFIQLPVYRAEICKIESGV